MRPDQERVRNLLIDTVTLLCKNSVQFKDELHVEGLLGVSVDKKEVFFVHISKEFTNSPSEGATVTQDATDSQDDESRLPDDSVDGRDSHQQKLSDRVREEQARIKTEIVDVEQECLIVEDPNIKLEGLVSPAQIIAGQRRAVKRTSHGGVVAGDSGQHGDQYHGDGMGAGGYGSEDISVDNSHYGQTGEPQAKRKADRNSDGGYNMTHGDEDPGGTPWPSIANVPGFDPSQQSFQQDSDNSQMSMTDGTQPGCSTWSTPGRGPSDSVAQAGYFSSGGGGGGWASSSQQQQAAWGSSSGGTNSQSAFSSKPECPTCGATFTRVGNLKAHMQTHTGERPHVCPICNLSFRRNSHLNRHMTAKHGAPSSGRKGRQSVSGPPIIVKTESLVRADGGMSPSEHTDTGVLLETC